MKMEGVSLLKMIKISWIIFKKLGWVWVRLICIITLLFINTKEIL
jgi:hypothetical protein